MQLGYLRLVMRPQRRGQQLDEQTRGRVEHRQEMRLREAAALALLAALTKVVLQFHGIGHREAAAVGKERAMTEPARGVTTGPCRTRCPFQQTLECRER